MKSPWFSLNHISHLATVEIRVVRLGSFQNLYLSFAIVEITHGVTANRDDTDFHHAKPQILHCNLITVGIFNSMQPFSENNTSNPSSWGYFIDNNEIDVLVYPCKILGCFARIHRDFQTTNINNSQIIFTCP